MFYKRCAHTGRDRDRCAHEWYGSLSVKGRPRVRVALAKWSGRDVTTKSAAAEVYDLLKQDVRNGVFNPNGRGVVEAPAGEAPTTLASLIARYETEYVLVQQQKTAGDFTYRTKPITDFFGPNNPIKSITSERIEAFQAELRKPRVFRGDSDPRPPSIATVNRPVSLLRRLLSWAVAKNLLEKRPSFLLDTGEPMFLEEDYTRWRRIDPAEEALLLAMASPRLRALIVLALDTGLRRGEMLKLRCADIDLLAGTITPKGLTTKDGRHRVLPIGTNRLRGVLLWFMDGKAPHMPLVDEAGMSVDSITTAWETCRLKVLGVPVERTKTANLAPQCRQALRTQDLHWHDLRHEFACRLDDRGVALGVIQRLLGHADIKTTERYLRRGAKELLAGAIKLDDGSRIDVSLPPRIAPESPSVCLKLSQPAQPLPASPSKDSQLTLTAH